LPEFQCPLKIAFQVTDGEKKAVNDDGERRKSFGEDIFSPKVLGLLLF